MRRNTREYCLPVIGFNTAVYYVTTAEKTRYSTFLKVCSLCRGPPISLEALTSLFSHCFHQPRFEQTQSHRHLNTSTSSSLLPSNNDINFHDTIKITFLDSINLCWLVITESICLYKIYLDIFLYLGRQQS